MDVISTLGYVGQQLTFMNEENLLYITGNGAVCLDLIKGPKEIIWKMDKGISTCISHIVSKRLVIAPNIIGADLEIVDNTYSKMSPRNSIMLLENPTIAKVISLSFNRNGNRLIGLTDTLDQHIICWDVDEGIILFSSKLSYNLKYCSFSPTEDDIIIMYGDNELVLGTVSEVLGQYSIKTEVMHIDQEKLIPYQDKKDMNYKFTFASWSTSTTLMVGTSTGLIIEVDTISKQASVAVKLTDSFPTCAVVSIEALIVGTSSGDLLWFQSSEIAEFISKNDPNSNLVTPCQNAKIDGCITTLVISPSFESIHTGSALGNITHFPVEIKEVAAPADDEAAGNDMEDAIEKTTERVINAVAPVRSFINHNDIAICTASLQIPIQSGTGKSKSTKKAQIYVTASHSGTLTFWQIPPVDCAEITSGLNAIRSFEPKIMKVLSKVNIDVDQSAICTLASFRPEGKGNIILFIGLTSGWLEVWTVMAKEVENDEEEEEEEEESGKIKLTSKRISRKKMYSGALSVMSVNEDATKLCIASHFENVVYVLSLVSGNEFPVVLHFSVTSSPVAAVWSKSAVWVVSNNGNVYSIAPDKAKASLLKVAEKGVFDVYPETCMTIGVQVLCANCDSNGNLYATSETGSLLKVVLPTDLDDAASNMVLEESRAVPFPSTSPVTECCLEHSDIPITSDYSPSGSYWATGCADGTVCIWNRECALVSKVKVHSDSIIGLSFAKNASSLMSCAADGSIFVYAIEEAVQVAEVKRLSSEKDAPINTASSSNPNLSWDVLRKNQLQDDLKGSYAASVKELKNYVQDISGRIHDLLSKNDEATDLEKLDRSEFIVDVDGKNFLMQKNATSVESLKSKYVDRNFLSELVAGRIKSTCWDTLESKQSALLPFSTSDVNLAMASVSSFSIQKLTEEDALLLDKVKRLRCIEIRSMRSHPLGAVQRLNGGMHRSSWSSGLAGFPINICWVNMDGSRWPSMDFINAIKAESEQEERGKDGKGDKDKDTTTTTAAADGEGGGGGGGDEGEEGNNTSMEGEGEDLFDEKSILNMLYPPQAVRTQVQKRTQLVLMKEVVRMMRAKFNEEFERLRREKDDVIASVESRNGRLSEIISELQLTDISEVIGEALLFVPKLADAEVVGSAVTVKDDEVSSRPYESDAVRAVRYKEEEDRRRKEAEKNKNDIKGRALDEMMHGTLEVKRDVFAEASSLQRPKWMDETVASEMTEEQVREVDAFEARFKEAQEEMAKYRKVLEQEFKKLRLEITDVCRAFDEKLTALAKMRVVVQKETLAVELYMTKVAASMTWREKSFKTLKGVEREIEETRRDRGLFRQTLERFASSVEELKKGLENVQEEERTLDKTFKRDLQTRCNATFDQDALKVFTQLFRQRTYPHIEEDGGEGGLGGSDREEGEESVGGALTASKMASAMGKSGTNTNNNNKSGTNNNKSGAMGRSKGGQGQSKAAAGAGGQSKRSKMKESKGASKAAGGALGPMQRAALALQQVTDEDPTTFDNDPFYGVIVQKEKNKAIKEAQIPVLNLLSLDLDCPEGFNLDQFTWAQLQELRTARILKEVESKKLELQYNDAAYKLGVLTSEDAALVSCINSLRSSRDELVSYLQTLESDVEVIVTSRQGQDEVDKDAVLTNYDEAIIIPTSIVGKFNFRVKELGAEKISVLGRKKEFRRKINTIDWDANHLSLEAKHLEEYFTDLQLMRVTRELQEVIREGADDSLAKERLDKIGSRKEFIAKDADARLGKMRKLNTDMRRQLSDRRMEIASLENKIQDLRIQVSERENVKKTRDNARGAASNPVSRAAQKMKKVVKRRHLVDTARAQAEEIDFLRQELDRMRQKTFPSFVRRKN